MTLVLGNLFLYQSLSLALFLFRYLILFRYAFLSVGQVLFQALQNDLQFQTFLCGVPLTAQQVVALLAVVFLLVVLYEA